jgi:DNA-binding response OmpR family regulator
MTASTRLLRRSAPRNDIAKLVIATPGRPVMMVTAYGDEQRRHRAGELGACEFLTKPVDFDLLKARLAQLPRVA